MRIFDGNARIFGNKKNHTLKVFKMGLIAFLYILDFTQEERIVLK